MRHFLHFHHVLFLFLVASQSSEGLNLSEYRTVYTFGDSLFDPGNNNYISTLLKSNFPPYGRDFVNRVATGRFTNGRQVSDFIASYVGYDELFKPYLDPTLSTEDLMRVISFASAGSGPDPVTPKVLNVIPYSKQLDHLKDCKKRLTLAIGMEKTQEMFENAVFILSGGNNDFILNYYNPLTPLRRTMFNVAEYENFLVQLVRQFIQDLWEQGARHILFASTVPLGCLPVCISVYSDNPKNSLLQRNCVESLNTASREFNQLVQNELTILQSELNGSKIGYLDFFGPVIDTVKNLKPLGLDKVSRACCGTGLVEFGPLCNPATVTCNDDSGYVFWDAAHPSEKIYSLIFEANRQVIDSMLQ